MRPRIPARQTHDYIRQRDQVAVRGAECGCRYQRRGRVDNADLLARLQAHAAVRARYGYRLLHTLVAREVIVANHKRGASRLSRSRSAGAPPAAEAPDAGRAPALADGEPATRTASTCDSFDPANRLRTPTRLE